MIFRLLVAILVVSTPAFCAQKRGKIRDHVYTSSKKDFSFSVPDFAYKAQIHELREKDQIIVHIQDMLGHSIQIEQVAIPEQCLPYFSHSDEQGLADVFGKAIMAYVQSLFPDSSVVCEQSMEVCGKPAHYALIERPLPLADHKIAAKEERCLEGICIFRKGSKLFVISTCNGENYPPTDNLADANIEYKKANYWQDIKLIAESFQFNG